ncbi:MAG: heme-copper oxidase subunit III [Planctomycetota bacterium]|nr:heme-copper oxidase subunit III [Planctomycetota bacterium]
MEQAMPLTQVQPKSALRAGGPPPVAPGEPGDGGSRGQRLPDRSYRLALYVVLAPVTMTFAALASSYIVRRGIGGDWRAVELPAVLWLNSFALLFSSVALEAARRGLREGRAGAFTRWWLAATALGVAFLGGQALAWFQLYAAGVGMASNISASFLYLLTAFHTLHLLIGVGALAWVALLALRARVAPPRRLVADLAAVYWHFLDGLWIFLFALMLVWR